MSIKKTSALPGVPGDDSFCGFYCRIRDKAADTSTFCGGRFVNESPFFVRQIDERFPL